jgi:hypothetical protein
MLVSKGASQDKLMVGRLFILLEDGLTLDQQYVLHTHYGMGTGVEVWDISNKGYGLDWALGVLS